MSDDEAFYDEHIAPELARLGKMCEERKMAFLAIVELPEGLARTETHPADAAIEYTMTSMAARAHGNFDAFVMALRRHAAEHGHGSVYLTVLDQMNERS